MFYTLCVRTHREIEIKLRVPDAQAAKQRLRQLGARARKREREHNTLFDTAAGTLRKRGHLLRIRRVGRGAVVTWKGPNQRHSRGAFAGYKVRAEREWRVSATAADALGRELRRRGLRPTFIYEKLRTSFHMPQVPGVAVMLDETPIGDFLELEGAPRRIDRAARLLGYAREDYLTSSYAGLYFAECRRRGRKPSQMRFRSAKK